MLNLFHLFAQLFIGLFSSPEQAFLHLTQPSRHSIVLSTADDLTRSKADLIVLYRQVTKPAFSQPDRLWLVLLANRVKNWKESLLIFKPDTLLGWHRQGFRLFWKFKSRNRGGRPKLATETVALIQQMAQENRLWGAERIRGELLKLGLTVANGSRWLSRKVAVTNLELRLRELRRWSQLSAWLIFTEICRRLFRCAKKPWRLPATWAPSG